MTKQEKLTPETAEKAAPEQTGLDLMRVPFRPNQISKLPKPTRQQTEALKKDYKVGIRCQVCGLWHHPKVVHLDYVGHAALTDRLLDCDPHWNWEALAKDEHGRPIFDEFGGMWIKLTVCGETRLGYGHPDGKRGGDAIKEVIGDALRNAAMRFGAALDLWHKGDLHATDDTPEPEADLDNQRPHQEAVEIAVTSLNNAASLDALRDIWTGLPRDIQHSPNAIKAKNDRKSALEENKAPPREPINDEVPEFT